MSNLREAPKPIFHFDTSIVDSTLETPDNATFVVSREAQTPGYSWSTPVRRSHSQDRLAIDVNWTINLDNPRENVINIPIIIDKEESYNNGTFVISRDSDNATIDGEPMQGTFVIRRDDDQFEDDLQSTFVISNAIDALQSPANPIESQVPSLGGIQMKHITVRNHLNIEDYDDRTFVVDHNNFSNVRMVQDCGEEAVAGLVENNYSDESDTTMINETVTAPVEEGHEEVKENMTVTRSDCVMEDEDESMNESEQSIVSAEEEETTWNEVVEEEESMKEDDFVEESKTIEEEDVITLDDSDDDVVEEAEEEDVEDTIVGGESKDDEDVPSDERSFEESPQYLDESVPMRRQTIGRRTMDVFTNQDENVDEESDDEVVVEEEEDYEDVEDTIVGGESKDDEDVSLDERSFEESPQHLDESVPMRTQTIDRRTMDVFTNVDEDEDVAEESDDEVVVEAAEEEDVEDTIVGGESKEDEDVSSDERSFEESPQHLDESVPMRRRTIGRRTNVFSQNCRSSEEEEDTLEGEENVSSNERISPIQSVENTMGLFENNVVASEPVSRRSMDTMALFRDEGEDSDDEYEEDEEPKDSTVVEAPSQPSIIEVTPVSESARNNYDTPKMSSVRRLITRPRSVADETRNTSMDSTIVVLEELNIDEEEIDTQPIIRPKSPETVGLRRGKRNRVKPVEFWRLERPVYQMSPGSHLRTLVGVEKPKGQAEKVPVLAIEKEQQPKKRGRPAKK